MPNSGDGTDWNETLPANTDQAVDGPQEIRDIRIGVRKRTALEHETFNSNTAGGAHKTGSAVAYFAANAPTLTPWGQNLDLAHAGRLWVDSDSGNFYYWTGAAWTSVKGVPSSPVSTTLIADGAVTAPKLGTNAVTSASILDLAITTTKLADTSVATGKLVDLAVTTAKLADLAVTVGKLADGSVTSAKILDGTIQTGDLADGAVATSKLANDAVDAVKTAASYRSKQDVYTGNGSATGPTVNPGFYPNVVIIFDLFGGGEAYWGYRGTGSSLKSFTGQTTITNAVNWTSTGFSLTTANSNLNTNGRVYLFLAFG